MTDFSKLADEVIMDLDVYASEIGDFCKEKNLNLCGLKKAFDEARIPKSHKGFMSLSATTAIHEFGAGFCVSYYISEMLRDREIEKNPLHYPCPTRTESHDLADCIHRNLEKRGNWIIKDRTKIYEIPVHGETHLYTLSRDCDPFTYIPKVSLNKKINIPDRNVA